MAKKKKKDWENAPKPPELRRKLDGVSLGKDKAGYFVYTHRARSSSYDKPSKIQQSKIKFIRSTGSIDPVLGRIMALAAEGEEGGKILRRVCRKCGKKYPPTATQCRRCANQAVDIQQKLNRGEHVSAEDVRLIEEQLYALPPPKRLTPTNSEKLKDFIARRTQGGEKLYTTTYAASKLLGFGDKESFVNYALQNELKPGITFDNALLFAAWKVSELLKLVKPARLERDKNVIQKIQNDLLPEAKTELRNLNIALDALRPQIARIVRFERKNPRSPELQALKDKINPVQERFEQAIKQKKEEIAKLEEELAKSETQVRTLS